MPLRSLSRNTNLGWVAPCLLLLWLAADVALGLSSHLTRTAVNGSAAGVPTSAMLFSSAFDRLPEAYAHLSVSMSGKIAGRLHAIAQPHLTHFHHWVADSPLKVRSRDLMKAIGVRRQSELQLASAGGADGVDRK